MRKTRGVLFILVGLALALASALMVLRIARQVADNSSPRIVAAPPPPAPTPIPEVYVVVAQKDLPDNVAISTDDVARATLPAALAPPGAIASPDIAVGKYTTTRIYKGEVLLAPMLAETKSTGELASLVPPGKVAMAVTVDDSMNSLGALRPGDRVDILLTLDLSKALVPPTGPATNPAAKAAANGAGEAAGAPTGSELSTQLTMQDVQILAIGAPAGSVPATTGPNGQVPPLPPGQALNQAQALAHSQAVSRVITFLLDRQDAVTLKYIKDSGGTMDLVVRSPDDKELAKTEAVTLDSIYRKYNFRFVQPVNP